MSDVMTPEQRRKSREERQIDAEKYPNLAQFAKPLDYPVREIVGRDDERTQILSNLCRPELSNVMLLAPPGSGKALASDTLIPVADKRIYVPISELEVGDGVYNTEGKKIVVSGVFPQGKKSAWEVRPEYGESIVCNDEHIWTVYDHAMDIQRTCTLSELLDMGMHYGDDKKLRFSVPMPKPVGRSGKYQHVTRATRLTQADFMVKEFMDYPEGIIKLRVEDRLACIDALPERFAITPRGRDTVVVHTGSEERALWVMRLLCTTGYAARIDRDPTCVQWAINTPEWQYIDAVSLDKEVDMTCIKVDSDDGLFQAGRSHIVTHNTALTQSVMLVDPEREYFEIDPARLINDLTNPNEMGARLKSLFDEAELYASREGNELVLFIDEFHQIVQLSEAAVEALKPVLADSGSRGLRFIAATTYDEYNKYIRPNAPLDERLQRITLTPTDDKQTVEILRNTATKYGVADQFFDDGLFEQIVEITNRYQPSSVQPRKSIRVLDSMIGRHRFTGAPMDMAMLMSVISDSTGMNLAFNINGSKIKEQLDANVYSQQLATTVVARRLQLVVADLHDKSRPQGSFLFAGPTGVGKATSNDTLVPVYDNSGAVSIKRNGDLREGDYVFDREGKPTKILGVFPQGKRDIYRVGFADGRTLDVDGSHLWTVYTRKQRSNKHAGKNVTPMTLTTEEMVEHGVFHTRPNGRKDIKFYVPAAGAVQWPKQDLDVDPYVLGAFIGNGCLTDNTLTLSSDDEYTVSRVADGIGASYKKVQGGYSWVFPTGEHVGTRDKLYQTKDALCGDAASLVGVKSPQRRIPEKYLHGSIEQRWELVRGLFDTDGSIGQSNGRFNVSYSTFSEGLAHDVRELLFSLGISNSVQVYRRTREREDGASHELVEYEIHVKVGNEDKEQFFSLPRKREIARRAVAETQGRTRVKKFDMVGITSIEKLPEKQDATCIYVDNEEHLYQVGQFIVTHNTELTKQIARLMFGDDRNRLIRFDMSEFARKESMETFRDELTSQVVNQGHAVVLLDEVEKADRAILRLLLQVLDDGRLNDRNGRQVSFLNTYIVMTTNAGSGVFKDIGQYEESDTGDGSNLDDWLVLIESAIRDTGFPPELLGRIDELVPFQPLSRATQQMVVTKALKRLRDDVKSKHNITMMVKSDVLTYITEDLATTDTNRGGARGAIRILNKEIATAVAKFINENPEYAKIQIGMEGELRAHNKHIRKSQAHPVIRALKS